MEVPLRDFPRAYGQGYAQVSRDDIAYEPSHIGAPDAPDSAKHSWVDVSRTLDGPVRASKSWSPPALTVWMLAPIILICGALIGVLQMLLEHSRKENGVLFAAKISDLSAANTFYYLYLPTLIATLFSILWSCVDLDAKRGEPWYQLSKPSGTTGRGSLLLQYPFDFIASVPWQSIRSRHWVVALASASTVLIFWALTPVQAGIFAVDTITRTFPTTMHVSTALVSVPDQAKQTTLNYTSSAFNIMNLNESLPAYMARDYVLAPFRPQTGGFEGTGGVWTSKTRKYSLDLKCETAVVNATAYSSSNGCVVPLPYGPDGNDTIKAANGTEKAIRPYSGLYSAYEIDAGGFADFYLLNYCPKAANRTFFASFVKNKVKDTDPPNTPTVIFCEVSYYYQDVNATVYVAGLQVKEATALGPKTPFPENIMDTKVFEQSLSSGVQNYMGVRGPIPIYSWPSSRGTFARANVTQGSSDSSNNVLSYALGADPHPNFDAYLDPVIWGKTWEKAYRLLFARAMVDVLSPAYGTFDAVPGTMQYQTQAVIVVPAFTYVVQAILGVLVLVALALIVLSWSRRYNLNADPAELATVMSTFADSGSSVKSLAALKEQSDDEITSLLEHKKFALTRENGHTALRRIGDNGNIETDAMQTRLLPTNATNEMGEVMNHRQTPMEYRTWFAVAFLIANVLLLVAVVVVERRAAPRGLPLASENRIVRQIVENYIPTVLATLLEAMWLVLNRIVCVLQPFEALRTATAPASKTLTLEYNAFPPQVFIFKAIKNRHFLLALICLMSLLANGLAIAASALFNEEIMALETNVPFRTSYRALLKAPPEIPLEVDASTFWRSENMYIENPEESFYMVMSNITSGTPLPPWTGKEHFFVPFDIPSVGPNTTYEANTLAYEARLQCVPLAPENATRHTVTLLNGNEQVKCNTNVSLFALRTYEKCDGLPQHAEFLTTLDYGKTPGFCQQYLLSGWLRNPGGNKCKTNATVETKDMTLIACHPVLSVREARIKVNSTGEVLSSTIMGLAKSSQNYFGPDLGRFARQINFLFLGANRQITGGNAGSAPSVEAMAYNGTWYNDTFPSDYFQYFAAQFSNTTNLYNPNAPAPSFNESSAALGMAYTRVFAAMLGRNPTLLQKREAGDTGATVEGTIYTMENRIVVSWVPFLITVAILGCYVVATLLLYIRRPGRFLPRLPTTIASVVAMVAASHALEDLRGTSYMNRKERKQFVEGLGHSYGYGPHVGTDERAHIGIERVPYLRTWDRQGGQPAWAGYSGREVVPQRQRSWRSRIGWRHKHIQTATE